MRGIVLAGGSGTRLYPMTLSVCKQLLPIYDKPMIYYPLTTLMLAGIREILIITTPEDAGAFRKLLGDGSRWGIRLEYSVQSKPEGIAQALIIGEEFLAGDRGSLILGDNLFFGHGLTETLKTATSRKEPSVFGYWVPDPERFGVAEFSPDGKVTRIQEKPTSPNSHWAVTGLYIYDERAPELAKKVKPSSRGELEITDLNNLYLEEGVLHLEKLGRGFAWLDTGTPDSLVDASSFVKTMSSLTGMQIACPEEIAWNNGWIDESQLRDLIKPLRKTPYGTYLDRLLSVR